MENIAKLIGTLCIASFVMGILTSFGQFAATEKVIRFVVSIFIIATLFKPFNAKEFTYKINFSEIKIEQPETIKQDVNALIMEKTKENLTELVKIRLRQKNISYIDLSVHILDQDGNLFIDKIIVTGCDELEREKIYTCLSDLISQETMLVLGE